VFAHIDSFDQRCPSSVWFLKIPRYADVEAIRTVKVFALMLLAFPSFRLIVRSVVLHGPVAVATNIQARMAASSSGFVTCIQESIELILRWLLNAEYQEPSVTFEVWHPFETLKSKMEGRNGSFAQTRSQGLLEDFSVLGPNLQRAREGDMQRQRCTEF
jgi:hypothetical protein